MDKIRKLEQRWRAYKAKKLLFLLIFVSIFYAVGAGAYYLFLNWNSLSSFFSKKVVLQESNLSTVDEKKMLSKVIPKEDINMTIKNEPLHVQREELSLKPIIPIIDMDKEKAHISKHITHKENTHARRVKAKPSTYLTAQELSHIRKEDKQRDTTRLKKINLYSSSKNYIETMKQKFAKSRSSRDALLLAKAFYRVKNYKASEKWALESNKLDSNLDESWIIFAQAKAKLGKQNEAIKILAMYYKRTKSPQVKAVIEKIKMGKL
jgi:hypothetical protein